MWHFGEESRIPVSFSPGLSVLVYTPRLQESRLQAKPRDSNDESYLVSYGSVWRNPVSGHGLQLPLTLTFSLPNGNTGDRDPLDTLCDGQGAQELGVDKALEVSGDACCQGSVAHEHA